MDIRRATRIAPSVRLAMVSLLLIASSAAALAQGTPFIPDSEKFGRAEDKGTLRYCVDPRDPEWEVARDIGAAIADALLLKPSEVVISDTVETASWDTLYRHFLTDCDVYFGFKLIPGSYPGWLALSRPYYQASYVLAVKDLNWKSLADIPHDQPIGSAIATTADFAFIKYLEAVPEAQRWNRFPMGTTEAVLDALEKGVVSAALVWGPAAWGLQKANRGKYDNLRLISPTPLAVTTLGEGATLLANESFLRSNVDQAIASLAADGEIDKIIAAHDFPATAVK